MNKKIIEEEDEFSLAETKRPPPPMPESLSPVITTTLTTVRPSLPTIPERPSQSPTPVVPPPITFKKTVHKSNEKPKIKKQISFGRIWLFILLIIATTLWMIINSSYAKSNINPIISMPPVVIRYLEKAPSSSPVISPILPDIDGSVPVINPSNSVKKPVKNIPPITKDYGI